jgi:hypothetical protein
MRERFLCAVVALVCLWGALPQAAPGQQTAPLPRRGGGLDNLSLPSTMARAAAAEAAAGGWRKVEPAGVGFSVLMPGAPEEMMYRIRQTERPLGLYFRHWRLRADGVEYHVMVKRGTGDDIENFQRMLRMTMPRDLMRSPDDPEKMQLTDEGWVADRGLDAQEFDYESERDLGRVRLYTFERLVYVLAMTGHKTSFNEEKAGKFFKSFAVGETR